MRKIYAASLIMSLMIFACGGETETVVTEEGSVTSKLGVIMNEWDVKPSPNYKMGKHIPPGDIEVTLTNAGQLEHNMYVLNQSSFDDFAILDDGSADISGLEVLLEISTVQPGQSGTGMITDLPAGTYAFICNIPGHYSSGTVGKFIVR
ncbi:MAG: sulfocyanin-like copper-binding protein [Dehalococcoidia bacterium]